MVLSPAFRRLFSTLSRLKAGLKTSERKLHFKVNRKKLLWGSTTARSRTDRTINIPKTSSRYQRIEPTFDNYILAQLWPVHEPDTIIDTDCAPNVWLKQKLFKRLCMVKMRIIQIQNAANFRRQFS